MRYYKNGNITTSPTIPNVIAPSHETILANGWYVYVDNPPAYDTNTQKIERIDVIEGVQQYLIVDLTPEEIREMTVPQTITHGQGKLRLLYMGLLPTVEAMIAQAGQEEQIYWEYWIEWRRDSAIINRLAPMIWETDTDAQLDDFFIEASKLR
jgi:hypothetical protein